jgi:hypothetical protein
MRKGNEFADNHTAYLCKTIKTVLKFEFKGLFLQICFAILVLSLSYFKFQNFGYVPIKSFSIKKSINKPLAIEKVKTLLYGMCTFEMSNKLSAFIIMSRQSIST